MRRRAARWFGRIDLHDFDGEQELLPTSRTLSIATDNIIAGRHLMAAGAGDE